VSGPPIADPRGIGFGRGGTSRPVGGPPIAAVRTRPAELRLGAEDAPERWTLRVQLAEVWDAIRVSTPPSEPVVSLKVRALEALFPDADFHEDFVLKLHGFEVLDENAPLADSGARDGSIFLLQHRRRRPVR
jgi:hypothetical protein